MKETVNLTQLYKVGPPELIKATCLLMNNPDDRFECSLDMPLGHKIQLWQYVSGNWDGLMCVVEFNDVHPNGVPISGMVKDVIGFTPFY